MRTITLWPLLCQLLICLFAASGAAAQPFNDVLQYDERGNLVRLTIDGRVTDFRYDGLDRLRAEGTPGNQAIGLDFDGNRLADGRSRYRVVPGAQRLAERDGYPMVHGPTGQVLSERAWLGGRWVQRDFAWNLAGRLSEVKVNGSVVATYSYNEAGQRTRKTLASPSSGVPAITLYRYDPAGQLAMEVAGSATQGPGIAVAPGQVLVRYFWHDATPVAISWPAMTPGNPYGTTDRLVYLHTDHLNTPRRATDTRGLVVWSWTSDAFGSTPPNEDVDNNGRLTTIHLRFPGQYYDAESGLHYNWHRYYDPQVGRYNQSDPIGLAGGINTYAYVNSQPTSLSDPLGLATYMCKSPLHALTGTVGPERATWAMSNVPMAHHRYLCVPGQCGGHDQRGEIWSDPLWGPGKSSKDEFNAERCEQKEPDNICIERCVRRRLDGPRPTYGIPLATDCQEWAQEVLNSCRFECSSSIPTDRPYIGYPTSGRRSKR